MLKNECFSQILEQVNSLDLAKIYGSGSADPTLSEVDFFKAQNSILLRQVEIYETRIKALKSDLEHFNESNESGSRNISKSPPKTPSPPKPKAKQTSSSPSLRGSPLVYFD